MKIGLAIATTGRSAVIEQTLSRLENQTRAPDVVLVVGATSADIPSAFSSEKVRFVISEKGLTRQRNHALDLLRHEIEVIVFIDDDYVPTRDFIAGVERLMTDHPEVVGASGFLIADGARSSGLSFAQADAMIERHEAEGAGELYLIHDTGTYGCNMAFRISAAPNARFDENLPLYGWLEDTDFSAHFARAGSVVRTNFFAGVHLGAKSGRTSGLRLGYSQIANPVFLVGKGTMRRGVAAKMATKNFLANLGKCLIPEPYIDRRGLLKGNMLAFLDLLRRRNHPTRILDF